MVGSNLISNSTLVSIMGQSASLIRRIIPKERIRDITRAALASRDISLEEMLRHGLAWIDEAMRVAIQNQTLRETQTGED